MIVIAKIIIIRSVFYQALLLLVPLKVLQGKRIEDNLLTFEDMEILKLAEDPAKTCFKIYFATSTGLAPEFAYFHVEGVTEGGLDGGNRSSKYLNGMIIRCPDRHYFAP